MLVVYGRVYSPRSKFNEYMALPENQDSRDSLDTFSNVLMHPGRIAAKAPYLAFSADSTSYCDTGEYQKASDVLCKLNELGFETPFEDCVFDTFEHAAEYALRLNEKIDTLELSSVCSQISLNNLEAREIVGYTSKFPKWEVAVHFCHEET